MKKEPIGYIYMFTNRINGKKYIGQHEYKNGIDENYFGSGYIFASAKEKYGIENFKFDILCWCDSKEELNNAESYFIGFKYYTYANTGRGYNIADGGNGGNKLRGKTEEEMKEIGKKKSETWSNKTEEEMREIGKKISEVQSISVVGINLKNGEVLKLESAKQGKEYGFNSGTITQCAKGKLKQHKGFKFYYKSDYEKLSKEDIKKQIEKDLIESRNAISEGYKKMAKAHRKPVVGINIKTNEILELNSVTQGEEYGFNPSNITACCKGKQKTHKGYKWYYKSDYLALQEQETIEVNLDLNIFAYNINISI